MRLASAARSSFVRSIGHFSSAIIIGVLSMQTSYAGPEGGQVVRGDGNIVRPNATTTNINQHTRNIAIDWQSFNVNQNETVNFYQPDSTSTALNRIFDQNASEIFGTINANGRVILVNANGIYFGQSAAVNVGALIASGMDIDPDAFMTGDWTFANSDGSTGGLIVNHGLLQAAEGGSISLFGGSVQNTGTILANYGSINLSAGEQVTIDFDGDGLIQFAVDGELLENAYGLDAAVSNSGTLRADSGRVLLSAASANDVFAQVVNNEGVIQARGVTTDGGRVFLTGNGGDVFNTGSIDVSSEQGTGGTVHVLGDRTVAMFDGASIDASGATGGGKVRIGGGLRGGEGLVEAQRTFIGSSAVIKVDATLDGQGGSIVVWSDEATRFYGTATGRGAGSGSGGFVEISGSGLDFRGTVDLSAANGDFGTLLLDPDDIVIAAGTGDGSDTGGGSGTLDDPTILASDTPQTYTVYESELEAAAADIILEAVNSITTSGGAFIVSLGTGIDITLRTTSNTGAGINISPITIQTVGSAGITLVAGSDVGAGMATISAGALVTGNRTAGDSGSISLTADSDVTLNGGVTTGNADGAGDRTSGSISITSGGNVTGLAAGTLTTGDSTVTGNNNFAASGAITINAAGNVDLSGAVTTGTTFAADDAANSGDLSITSSGGAVVASAAIGSGTSTGDDQASTSGDVVISGDTGVALSGNVSTGAVTLPANDAAVSSGLIDIDTVTSGDIVVAGLATGSAITTAAGGGATSGAIDLNAADAIILNGAVVTGLATSPTSNATTGNVTMQANNGGISGAGTVLTGNATGEGNGIGEFATVGNITLTATGDIQLSAANALTTGAGELTDDAGGNDNINLGDITLSGAAISSDDLNGQLQVAFGSAVRANANAAISRGLLTATTTGGAGDAGGIFVTSATDMYVGALATDAGTAQNVNIGATGSANLVVTDASESLAGDAVTLDAGAGVLTVNDTAFALGAGSLTAIGEEIDFNGGAGSISGTGSVVLHASNIATDVRVGDSASAAARLDITDADLAALADGFAGITIGRIDSTATLTTDAPGVLFSDAITLEMSAGNIVLEGNVLTAGEGITLNAAGIDLGAIGGVSIDATNSGAAPTGANIVLNGVITDAGNDSSFTVNAGTGGTLDLDNVVTGLGQTYTANNIDLNGTTYQSTGSGAITFNGTVDLDNGGTTTVQTAGTLSTDDIVFSSSIDGASALVLQAVNGDIDIGNGTVGGVTPLTSLTVASANTLAVGTATTAGTMSLTATAIGGSGSDIVLTSNMGSIDVTGNVTTAGNAVDITAATGVTTAGSITTTAAADSGLTSGSVSLDVTGAGNISIGTIDTSGANSTVAGVNGGAGGAVTIATVNGTVTVADITSSGGNHNEPPDTLNNGGAAGAIGITSGGANDINLNGQLVARGGTTSDASGSAGAGATVTLSSGANIAVVNAVDPDINADALSLTAAGNGGTLTTQVETLTASADTGFSITNTGDLTATLSAANGTATLVNTGTLATGGAWAADAFDVDATGAITLDHTVTSDNGNVDVASSAALATVNAAVTSSAQALVSGVGVTNSATITGNTGVTVNAGAGTFTNTATTGVLSNNAGASNITIIADGIDLQSASAINGGTGTVTIRPFTNGTALNLGSATGALDISSAEAQTVTASTLTLGDATDTGAVTLDQFEAGALNVSITGTSIDDVGDAATHLATTGNVTLTATTGAIGATGVGLVVDVAGIAATTSNQNITLAAIDFDEDGTNTTPANLTVGAAGIASGGGNVVLNVADDVTLTGAINAGTGAVTITAGNASLDNATADNIASVNGAGLITGSSIDIDAVSGIGNTVALNTASTSIAADTTNGAVDINNTSATNATVTTLSSGDSSVTFDQAGGGDLLLGSVTAVTTATLSSTAGINDAAANPDTTADVTAATASLSAGTGIGNTADVDLSASSISAASAAGAIAINNAASQATVVTGLTTDSANISFMQTGGFALDVQAATTATSGDITISNDSAALTAGSGAGINSAGNVALTTTTGGDIVLADVSGTTVTVTSAGNINDGSAAVPVVTATDLALSAQTGIANLDIDATTVAATTVSGNLELIDANALQIGTVGGLSGVTISAGAVGDDISITTGTALTTTGNATDDIDNRFGNINLVAGTTIGASGTPVLVELNPLNGVLNLDAGSDMYVASTSALDLGSIVTGMGAHDVSVAITSTAASLRLTQNIDAGVNAGLSGDNLVFSIAGTSLPTAPVNDSTFDNNGFTIDVDTGSLSITADTINLAGTIEATGNISVAAADEGSTIGLGNVGSAAVAGQNFVLTNGTLLTLLNASGGSLTVGSASAGNVIMDGVDISTIANGTLHVVTGSTVADDDVTAGHGFVGGLDDTLRITSNGVIGVADGLSVNSGAIDIVSSGGNNIDLDIFTDHGNVELSVVTGGAGSIDITQNTDVGTGTRNLRIDNIDTSGAVTVTNNTGSISETSISGDAGVDIAGSSIMLTASGGVGAGFALELASADITATSLAGTVNLNNDATGLGAVSANLSSSTNINFVQTGDESLTLTSATAASGVVVSNDGGDLAAISVTSSGAGSDVTLTTMNSGNILLGSVNAADAATITSAGTINDAGADSLVDITAASATLNSVGGMGASAAVELDAGVVDVTNISGAVVLTSALASGTADVSIANTGGSIDFTQTGAAALLVNNFSTTTSGDINISNNNTGTDISILDLASAGDVTISATNTGAEVIIGGLITAANSINVTAEVEIFEAPSLPYNDADADFVAQTVNLTVQGNGDISAQVDAQNVSAQVGGITSGSINIENLRGDTAATTVTNLSLAGAGNIDYTQTGGAAVGFQNAVTTNGSINLSNDNANLAATSVDANGAGADATLVTTTGGTISLGSVSATDQVSIASAADVIENANDTTANVIANSVAIAAQTGIGASSAIDFNAPTISNLTTVAGGIDVRGQGQANFAFTSVDADAGNVTLTVDSGNMAATAVNADAGDVRLETVTSGNIVLGSVSAAGRDVSAIAAGAINDNVDDNVVDVTSATATLSAQTGIGAGNGNIDLAVGVIDAASTATGGVNLRSTVATTFSNVTTTGAASNVLIAGTGNTTITGASTMDGNIDADVTNGNLVAGTLTAGGATRDVFLDTIGNGNIVVGDVTATDVVNVTSAGTINDDTGGNDTDADLTGATVTLSAAGGVGNTDRVEVSATGLSATNNTSGDIVLGILGDVTLSGGIANNAAGGALDITAIDGDLDTGAGVLSTSGGNITLTATDSGSGGNLTVGSGGISTGSSATVSLNAADNIILIGNTNAFAGTINVNAGDDTFEAAADSTGEISGAGVLTATTVNLDAATGIGVLSAINTAASNVSADTADDDVNVSNTLGTNTTLTSMSSASGDVAFTQNGAGGLLVGAVTTTGAASLTSATTVDDASVADTTTADITAGSVALTSVNAIGASESLELVTTDITANVTTSGNVVLSNTSATDATLTSVTTASGDVTFTQNGAGDLLVGNVSATGAGLGVVTLTSAAAIEDATAGVDAGTDVTANQFVFNAVNGIGGTARLELTNTAFASSTFDNSGTGNIDLHVTSTGTSDLALTNDDGNMSVAQVGGGLLGIRSATTVTSGDMSFTVDGGNLGLDFVDSAGAVSGSTTTSGNIHYEDVVAATSITLNSFGDFQYGVFAPDLTKASNGAADIVADSVTLNAGVGGVDGHVTASGSAIEISAETVSASANGVGVIAIHNILPAPTAVSVTSLSAESGSISYVQSGASDVTFDSVVTSVDGSISLQNDSGDITATSVVANGAGNFIDIVATTSGDIFTGAISAPGVVSVDAQAGAIEAINAADGIADIIGTSIDLDAASGIGTLGALELDAANIAADTTTGNIDLDSIASGATVVSSLTTDTGTITFDQTGSQALTITNAATATSGAIDISNVNANLTLTNVSAGGANNVTATTTTGGNILVGAINAAGDTVALTSAGAINDATADTATDITAAIFDLDAASGIGNTADLELAGTAISANTTTGNINIDNTSAADATFSSVSTGFGAVSIDQAGGGDMLLGDISGTTTVSLSSTAAIEESGADAGADVTGATMNLTAASGIGVLDTLEISGTTVSGVTTNNNIDLANIATAASTATLDTGTGAGTGSITFTQTGGFALDILSATTDNGAITLGNTAGNLVLTSVSAGGANNINATTTTSGNITATSVNAAGDTITLGSAGAMVAGNITAATLNATSAGTIADDNTGVFAVTGTTTLDSTGNTITLDEATNNFGTVVITSGSNVTLRDANSINLGAASVSGTYDVTANAIDVTGAVTANAIDFDVSGGAGDIVDSTGTLTVATTSTLLAGAANSIALDGLNDFNTVVVDNAVAGNDANNVTLNDINAVVLGTSTIAGTLDVTAAGNITTSGNLAGAGFVLDSTTGSLTLDNTLAAGASGVDLDAATTMTINQGITTTGGGAVDLQSAGLMSFGANGDITSAGTVGVTSTGAAITMADGTVFITTGGSSSVALTADTNVALGRINGSSTVDVTATTGTITDITALDVTDGAGNENIVGTVVTLNAATGIGTFVPGGGHAGDIDINADQLSATLSSDGNIGIYETDNVYLDSIDAGLTAGNSLIIEAVGDINDHAGDQLFDVRADIGELIAGGNIGGAPLSLAPDSDTHLDLDITNLTLTAGGTTDVLDVGFGTVNLSFDNDADFTYTSLNRNIEIGFIDASGVNINDVTITTDNGWIRDDGADAIDILATGVITLSARDGIGVDETGIANGTLNLAGATIDLQTTSTTTGQGDIAVAIDADAVGSAITVTNLVAGNDIGGNATGTVSVTQAGSQSLTVNNADAAGGVNISNAGGTLTADTIGNITGGGVSLAADGITVSGVITTAGAFVADSTDAVVIDSNVTADSMDIDADTSLDITATLATTEGGVISLDAVGLTSLELGGAINSGGTVSFGAADATNTIDLGGTITTSNDAVNFRRAVNLVAGSAINTNGGNVAFDATVDGAEILSVNAGTGSVTFSGDVGTGTVLDSLGVTGGAVSFAGDITTNGAMGITNSDLLTLAAGSLVTADGGFTQAGTGTTSLGSGVTTSGDNITFAGAVTLTDNIVLSTGTGATVGFGGVITGGTNGLTVTNAGGGTTFSSASDLGALSVSGTTTATGNIVAESIALSGNTTLGTNAGLDATTGGVTIAGALVLTGGGTSVIETSGNNDIIVTGNVSGSHGLTMNAGRNISIGGGTGTVSLSSGTATFDIDADGDSNGASLNAGSISANAVVISGSGDEIVNVNNIAATNGVTLNSALQLGRNLTVNSGSFDANGTLTGARTLSVNATGNAAFETISGLTGIAVNANNVSFNNAVSVGGGGVNAIASNAINLGADVTSAGSAINLGGNVILGGDIAISTGSGAGAITIADSVTGSADDLTLTAGTGAITLGDVDGVSTLDLNSSGTFTLAGAVDVGTFDAGGLSGSMRVDGSSSIRTSNSEIDLSSVSGINGSSAGDDSLSLNAGSADVTLVAIGGSTRLASFTARGGSIDARAISTTGNQTFNGDLVTRGNLNSTGGALDINGDLLLASNTTMSGSGIDISGTVDGARSLNLVASGNVRVGGGIGQDETQRVQNLSIDSATATVQAVTTSGNQSYDTNLTTNGDLTSHGGALSFDGSLAVNGDITVTADTVNLRGGDSSVTGSADSSLTLLPFTDARNIVVGSGGGDALVLRGNALDGFGGDLYIGGASSDMYGSPVTAGVEIAAGTISVNEGITVGGNLALLSTGGITLVDGRLTAGDNLLLVASDAGARILNEGKAETTLTADTVLLVSRGQVGDDGSDIVVSAGTRSVQLATEAGNAFIQGRDEDLNPTLANLIARAVGVNPNVNVQVQSSAQTSANREQSSGLANEGFIDPSLFEDIALYEVSGSGIALPSDQSEEEVFDDGPADDCNTEEQNCELEATGAVGVISPR